MYKMLNIDLYFVFYLLTHFLFACVLNLNMFKVDLVFCDVILFCKSWYMLVVLVFCTVDNAIKQDKQVSTNKDLP